MIELKKEVANYGVLISDEEWNELSPFMQKKTAKKREIIFKQTERCDHVIFITSGITASLYNYNGKEVITRFFQKGNFSSNIISAKEKSIASDSLLAITKVDYFLIPFDRFVDWYLYSNTFGLFIRKKLIENSIENKHFTTIKTISETEIRYQFLEQYYPKLIKETPSKYIAKFLGLTSSGFSRFLSNRPKY
ncbi:MAG: cyclic nucleotide-binding domain-containing protein [Bacteroidota bacterium]